MLVDYKKSKERFKPNILGSLYINKKRLNDNERPVIYIGGQMEHRFHILEQTGKTIDQGHSLFDGSWFYEYPIFNYDKSLINGEEFAKNLLEALKMANVFDVDLVTESYGGIIGAYASKDASIHKVYAIHPPILGTPLANPNELSKYKKLFLKKEKLALLLLKRIVKFQYGFEKDNYNGIDFNKVDLDKLVVIGSNLNPNSDNSTLAILLYKIILKVTGFESDGVVIFDEEKFDEFGIKYIREDNNLNHFAAGSRENIEKVKNIIMHK